MLLLLLLLRLLLRRLVLLLLLELELLRLLLLLELHCLLLQLKLLVLLRKLLLLYLLGIPSLEYLHLPGHMRGSDVQNRITVPDLFQVKDVSWILPIRQELSLRLRHHDLRTRISTLLRLL